MTPMNASNRYMFRRALNDEVCRMNYRDRYLSEVTSVDVSAFRQGLIMGFAAPFLFAGHMPQMQRPQQDNIARAWRNVGASLRFAMKKEADSIDERNR